LSQEVQINKFELLKYLASRGVSTFHANFEPIPTLTVFANGHWEKWVNTPEWNPKNELMESNFPNAFEIYRFRALGLSRTNFQSKYKVKKLIAALESFCKASDV
jgi:hypothetical protein